VRLLAFLSAEADHAQVHLVRGEGGAAGRKPPLELPLGAEAFDKTAGILEDKLKEMAEWRDFGSDVKVD
jgi:hypothetical protein